MTTEQPREFFDVVLNQRACRSFDQREVDDTLIEQILTAATHAPSAENLQPWVFLVVRDDAQRARVGDLTRRAWNSGGREHSASRLSPEMMKDVDQGAEFGTQEAPVTIILCGDATIGLDMTLPSSVFPAAQNLLLAASALGLGSTMTTLATMFAEELSTILDLPDSVRPMAVIPIGWPKRPLGPPKRLSLAERAHRDRYNNPW